MANGIDAAKALRDGAKPKDITYLASDELMKQVTRDADYKSWIKDFLGGK